MWARDVGRAVSELAELGFDTATRAAVDFFDRTLDLCSPPHWTRNWGQETVSRKHQTYEGLEYVGQAQNNGHALVMVARYHVWLHTGKSLEWLRSHWEATVKATEWICWQLDHRKTADQPDGLVHEEGEEGFGWGASYANFACYTALRMSVAMAETLGATEEARRWAAYCDRMKTAIGKDLPEQGARGPSWRYHRRTDWNDYNQSLAPIMLICDFESFDPQDTDRHFLDVSLNTYLDRLGEPSDYEDCRAFGYGQGFITQAALLLDRMGDATRFVGNTAKYIYDPREYPWVASEGTVVHESGRYWYRMGMFANQIQIASIVKILRLLVGIDDLDSRRLKILPRLPGSAEDQPAEWEGITVSSYPVLCDDGGGPVVRKLGYRLARKERRLEFELSAEQSLPDLSVRLGPLPADTAKVRLTVDGRAVDSVPVASGDSKWVWVRHLAGVRRTRIVVGY